MSVYQNTILVTGGSRGIGRAVVQRLAQKGANVVFTYKENSAAAHQVEAFCQKNGNCAAAYRVDTQEYRQIKELAKDILQKYGRIDAVVNNAGIRRDRTVLYMEPEEWQEVVGTNLTGVFYTVKGILPYMLKNRQGRIVNISSVSGLNGLSGQTNYSASKAGVLGFTKALAKEVAEYGVSVNAVAPGAVDTEMLEGLPQAVYDKFIREIPLKRICQPEEVAMLVEALVDREITPPYLTGQVIALDGGMGL